MPLIINLCITRQQLYEYCQPLKAMNVLCYVLMLMLRRRHRGKKLYYLLYKKYQQNKFFFCQSLIILYFVFNLHSYHHYLNYTETCFCLCLLCTNQFTPFTNNSLNKLVWNFELQPIVGQVNQMTKGKTDTFTIIAL